MCDLCVLEPKTPWFYEDDDWVILQCDTCRVPMLVYREHSMIIPIEKLKEILEVVGGVLPGIIENIRANRPQIHDHWHVHLI